MTTEAENDGSGDDFWIAIGGVSLQMFAANEQMQTGGPGKTNFLNAEDSSLCGLGAYTGITDTNFSGGVSGGDYRANATTSAHSENCLTQAGNVGALIFCYFFNDAANTINASPLTMTNTPQNLSRNVGGDAAFTDAEKSFGGQVQLHLIGSTVNNVVGAFDQYFCAALTSGLAGVYGYSAGAGARAVDTCAYSGAASFFSAMALDLTAWSQLETILIAASNYGSTAFSGAAGPSSALLGNSAYCNALGSDTCDGQGNNCNVWTIDNVLVNRDSEDRTIDCAQPNFWKG